MVNSLFLTSAERKLFDALPEAVRAEWKVAEEKGTRYETDKELVTRAGLMELETFPQLKKMVAEGKKGKKMNLSVIAEIPKDAYPEFFFTIGARGMTQLIGAAFSALKNDDGVQFIAAVSHLRHDVLNANSRYPVS